MRRKNLKSLRRFEKLENRWMMAADIDLDNDVLTIQGTNNDDYITVESTTIVDDGDVEDGVLVTIRESYNGPALLQETFERDQIDELKVYALDGNDWVANLTDIPGELWGGNDNDGLIGGSANDWIYGEAGDDVLKGYQGNDHLAGGVGNDDYSFFTDIEGGVVGSDVVYEDASADVDTLFFHDFDAPINLDLASTAWQVVHPVHLSLRLSTDSGIEDVHGSALGDTIRGNSRDNYLNGEGGNDDLYGRGGADRLEGTRGDDDLYGEAGNDTYVFSGTTLGTDSITEAAKTDTDTLDFTDLGHWANVDLAKAYSGSNPEYALAWAGTMVKLSNSSAIENVLGTAFDDSIKGNWRNNYLFGGDRNDEITGCEGDDKLEGGRGDDIYIFAGAKLGTDEIIEAARADNDGLRFSGMLTGLTIDLTRVGSDYAVNETDLKLKLANDTAIERVWGTDYNDIIIGNGRNNRLYGRGSYDTIVGGAGADYLHGGDDQDYLFSDALDEVYGGAGVDYFEWYGEQTWSNPNPARYKDWGVI